VNAGIQGTQGTQGALGTQGAQGLQGITGANGSNGSQGIQGIQGLLGIQGAQGTQGLQGTEGSQGTQGIQGTQGAAGFVGSNGAQGTQGEQGIQGIQGIQGTQGTQGIQGIQGTQGTQGIQGIQGITGSQGTQGTQGLQGITGAQGTQGAQGLQGTQGTQGIQGIQGITGIQGAIGSQGTLGTQGAQGTQGIQGISGASILGTNNNWTGTNTHTYNGPEAIVITGTSASSTSLKIVNSNYAAGNYWHLANDSLGGFTLNKNGSDLFNIGRSGTTAASFAGTISASNFSGSHSGTSSGTNTGDQTNISGNAATATTATNQSGGTVSATTISATGSITKSSKTVPSVAIQSGVGSGTPTALQNGDLWWNTDTGVLNIWYSTASAWVAATPVPDSAVFYRTSGGNITGNVAIQGLLSVTGNIQATGTITGSYSDERLKDVSGKIKNALAKVMLLNGVEFKPNDTAKYYGFNSNESEVGVIAQQVQAVLPEVVKPAPFDSEMNADGVMVSKSGENYITVQYERMVPLLIEAIKEQQAQIEKLNKALEKFIKE
jgi:hypothetical protein